MINLPASRSPSAAASAIVAAGWGLLISVITTTSLTAAEVPRMIDYQGRIAVGGTHFDGTGLFKFALVDATGSTTYWSHDSTASSGGAPATAISLPVVKGLYSVRLGDASIPGMSPLPSSALDHAEVRLRLWFNDGLTGFQLLTPDRRITAVAYALMAADVQDGAISSAKLADGSVTAAKIAPGTITADRLTPGLLGQIPAGAIVASILPEDSALLAQGYSPVQTFPGGAWTNPATGTPPNGRARHTAVWTGSTMIIWGGEVSGLLSGLGGTLDPVANSWTLLNANNLSPPRAEHTAVWGNGRMILWGGRTASGDSNTGALYNPANQAWLAMETAGAPAPRKEHTAVWTGEKMIVWGGGSAEGTYEDGAVFTPASGSGTWSGFPGAGPPMPNTPAARRLHTAIWTGSRMVIFGGEGDAGLPLNDGASWDPVSGAWTPLPATGAPSPRLGHTAVWTGSRMIVFGGAVSRINSASSLLNDGASWDASANTWTPLPAVGTPEPRTFHSAMWTGKEMLVTSGEGAAGTAVDTGAAYQPTAGSWRPLPSSATSGGRRSAVWSGQRLLTFGFGGLSILDPKPPVTLYGRF